MAKENGSAIPSTTTVRDRSTFSHFARFHLHCHLLVAGLLLRVFWLPPMTEPEKIAYLRRQHRLWRFVLLVLGLAGGTIASLATVHILSIALALGLLAIIHISALLVVPAAVLSDVDHPF